MPLIMQCMSIMLLLPTKYFSNIVNRDLSQTAISLRNCSSFVDSSISNFSTSFSSSFFTLSSCVIVATEDEDETRSKGMYSTVRQPDS